MVHSNTNNSTISVDLPSTASGEVLHTEVDIVTSPTNVSHSPSKSQSTAYPVNSWPNHFVTFTVTLVFAVGTGNVWNIPAMCAKHGGGVFLIQFAVCLVFAAAPLLLLEISLGQFSSKSPFSVFRRLVPAMSGLVGSFCFFLILRYVTSSVWAAHNFALLSASFTGIGGDLPWQNCNETHHGINNTCYDYRLAANCSFAPPTLSYCSQFQHSVIATRDTLARRTPFIHYVSNTVFKMPSVISDLSFPYWPSCFCLLMLWPAVLLLVWHAKKVIPHMSAIVLLSSLAVYLAMFVFGFFLENSFDGLEFLYKQDLISSLFSLESWSDAAGQAVTSLNLACGGIIMLSSLRPFNNRKIFVDSLTISSIALLFYTATTITAFLYVGSFSAQVYPHLKSENRIRLTIRGEQYIQAIFPEIFSGFKGGWALSAIFFFTEFLLAANTLVVCLWVVFSMFSERAETYSLPWNLRPRMITVAPIVVVGFLASLVLVSPGGFGALFVIDDITAFISLILALLQLLTVAYLYGFRRFTVNIRCMMSTLSTFNAYWWIHWVVTGPILILACILTGILNLILNPAPFDRSLLLFSWLLVVAAVAFVPVMFIINWRRNRNRGGLVQSLLKPTPEWRPLVDEDNKKAIRLERAMRVR